MSARFKTRVFVKAWPNSRVAKFEMERAVNQQLNQRLLVSGPLVTGYLVLVLRDWQLTPLPTVMTPTLARTLGQTLRQFHDQVTLPMPPRIAALDFERTANRLTRLRTSRWDAALTQLWQQLAPQQTRIEADLRRQPLVVCHGDVGVRNYFYHDQRLVLIDYERAQVNWPQTDFIKLWTQGFAGEPTLITAFQQGYGPVASITDTTQAWLWLQCAAGIFEYVRQIPEDKFTAVGERLLAQAQALLMANH